MVVATPIVSIPEPKRHGRSMFRSLMAPFSSSTDYFPKGSSLYGQVAIVTGATSGPGLEACRQLLSCGVAKLIMSARKEKQGEWTAEPLRTEFPASYIEVWELEMDSHESISKFANRAHDELERLDMAILTGGFLASEMALSDYKADHDMVFQLNFLHVALLGILLLGPLNEKSPEGQPGRLTVVTLAKPPKDRRKSTDKTLLKSDDYFDPKSEMFEHLMQSTLLAHFFVKELARQIPRKQVLINTVCPHGARQSRSSQAVETFSRLLFGRTLSRGASTYIDAVAVKGKESHGKLIKNCRVKK
ncbi:hypothetical protein IL306_002984 [Fusarium sp. DS 682]|nr:hypothetical protein IL306_002984 [Fusarium sp. DS 682]